MLSLDELPGPACLLVEPDGRVGEHNASFAAWTGRADASGVTLGELFPGDPVIAGLWDDVRAFAAMEHHIERRGVRGEPSFWSVRGRRVERGALMWACDLSAFADAARAACDSQRSFVALAAHDLRAPLSAIKAWASALSPRRRSGAGDGALHEDGLSAIARQVDAMNELLSDLLEAAREGPGALRAPREEVPLAELIERALAASSAAGRVALDGCPADRAWVDAGGVALALARLVDVAAKRADDGPIAVRASRRGVELHVHVEDAGPPISPMVEAELFSRAGPRARRAGLGLHVARLLAAASGGRVFREEERGVARFVLTLPSADAPRRAAGLGPSRVLIASRDEGLAARAAALLRLEGHHVVAATRDQDAVDLAIVDLRDDGSVDAVAELHDAPDPPAIVVLAPGGPRSPRLAGAERAGALAVLHEPIDWAELVTLAQIAATARLP